MYYICIDPGTATPESESDTGPNGSSSLVHYCRNCGHREPVREEICVSKLQIKSTAQNYGNIINRYTKLDPTLPRIGHVKCPNALCASNPQTSDSSSAASALASGSGSGSIPREVIYIRYDEENMKYVYLCAVCDALWSTVQAAAPV
jgi:DNA-directed RNA polymerase subunit M/transcription elongation factor TFIIS